MKKALLIAAAVMFVATSASAVLPPIGYIGIFADAAHSVNSVCPAAYAGFPAWIYILPSEDGMQAAEWAVSFPATVITLATVQHPNITVALGTLAGGISVAFGEGQCNMDWVWTHQLTLMSLAANVPVRVDIIPHPATLPVPAYQAATCELGYPIQPLIYFTPLYLCQEGALGVQETNWGAIKSLF